MSMIVDARRRYVRADVMTSWAQVGRHRLALFGGPYGRGYTSLCAGHVIVREESLSDTLRATSGPHARMLGVNCAHEDVDWPRRIDLCRWDFGRSRSQAYRPQLHDLWHRKIGELRSGTANGPRAVPPQPWGVLKVLWVL